MDLYRNPKSTRVGANRTLTDGVLWDWLEMTATYEYLSDTNSFYLWDTKSQERLDHISLAPTFHEDSRSFCTELTFEVKTAMNNEFDYENHYDLDTFRAWGYAENYIDVVEITS